MTTRNQAGGDDLRTTPRKRSGGFKHNPAFQTPPHERAQTPASARSARATELAVDLAANQMGLPLPRDNARTLRLFEFQDYVTEIPKRREAARELARQHSRILANDRIREPVLGGRIVVASGSRLSFTGRRAKWSGILALERTPTGDGRSFDVITWRDDELPMPFQWQKETAHGSKHDVTVNVGAITRIWRAGKRIMGEGYLDLGNPDGAEAHRRMQEGYVGGVSVVMDADPRTDQPRVRTATLVDTPAFSEARVTTATGSVRAPTAAQINRLAQVIDHHTFIWEEAALDHWRRYGRRSRLPGHLALSWKCIKRDRARLHAARVLARRG